MQLASVSKLLTRSAGAWRRGAAVTTVTWAVAVTSLGAVTYSPHMPEPTCSWAPLF